MHSLYELSVETFLRTLDGAITIMEKGEQYYQENNKNLDELITMQLADDMLPFTFQVNSVRHHSLNAVKGMIRGEFNPPEPLPKLDYQGLKQVLIDAREELQQYSEDEINALVGNPMYFRMGDMELPFSTENFILSFSIPNLYFHLATLYDMLRMNGVPLSKSDYLSKTKIGLPE